MDMDIDVGLCAGPTSGTLTDWQRPLAMDLKNAQVKTLSFLVYLLRQYGAVIRPHQVTEECGHIDILTTLVASSPVGAEALFLFPNHDPPERCKAYTKP